jgi:allantoinase
MNHMRNEFGIRTTRLISRGSIEPGIVVIRDEKIADILGWNEEISFPLIDIGHDVLMPGIVDPHVHINEPGRTEWEGFDTATRAAIAGGITTLVEMPLNASPVTTTVKAFEKKIEAADGKIHCNCGFWGGLIPGNKDEIEPLIEKGVLGFKAFLTDSGIDEFPKVTESDLREAMPILKHYDLPLLVHCELSDNHPQTQTALKYRDYLLSRPKKWEDDAIALMIRLCKEYNCPVHIVHLSSADSLPQIEKAKHDGLPLTVETAQHYLYFNAEDISDGETLLKCAPPIREKANNEKLWQALKSGLIDFVATDHSPALPSMKQNPEKDFMKAWGGISSIQLSLPALWTAAIKHGESLAHITKWLCENPAKLPRLLDKGKIEKGYDADLVGWSPERVNVINEKMLYHRHAISPYCGERLKGEIHKTWLAGEQVYENETGNGKFLHLNKGSILYHEC